MTGAFVAIAALAIGMWWTWPALAGDDGELDVLVAADAFVVGATRSVELRVREEGWAIAWSDSSPASWCDDPGTLREEVDRRRPGDLVLSFADGASDAACVETMVGELSGAARVVVVVQPGVGPDPGVVSAAGGEVADPGRLIGAPGDTTTRGCEWWESCEVGVTTVREPDGTLTVEGGERVARVLVAALRA